MKLDDSNILFYAFQINWQVSKAGIQGQFNPTGNYFPKTTNNLGFSDYTITVIEASLPGRPRSVNATQKTAQSIVLAAEPPVEDNCIQVIAFEIVYRIHGTGDLPRSLLFTLGKNSDSMLSIKWWHAVSIIW